MEPLLWIAIAILLCIAAALALKIFLIKKSVSEISREFSRRLTTDTNTLIDVPHRDKTVMEMAENINRQLRLLRKERRRFQQGDLEIREAVTDISHDLRTPLTAICGYLDLLRQEESTADAKRYLSQVENRVEALKKLTEELFRYSLISSSRQMQLERLDMRSILEDSIISFYGIIKQKDLTPDISLPEDPVFRLLDPSFLSRIFGNIISNALKYSDGDLRIVLDEAGTVTFSNQASGLDPVSAGRLLDRFYTVENARGSTGLGLSIAKMLTEQMDGSVRSEYRKGRLFIILSFPGDDHHPSELHSMDGQRSSF